MIPEFFWDEPVSSFRFPVADPGNAPGDEPLETCQINSDWLALLRGCAKQLLQPLAWRTTDPATLESLQGRAADLIDLLQDLAVPITVMPVGGIIIWPDDLIPDKWLLCGGQALLRDYYADLFAVIGTTYGSGDGSTTFNAPNLMARFPLGADDFLHYDLGNTGGNIKIGLTVNQIPAHHHRERTIRGSSPFYNEASTSTGGGSTSFNTVANTAQTNGTPADLNTADTGSGDEIDITPPFQVFNYIIFAGI